MGSEYFLNQKNNPRYFMYARILESENQTNCAIKFEAISILKRIYVIF